MFVFADCIDSCSFRRDALIQIQLTRSRPHVKLLPNPLQIRPVGATNCLFRLKKAGSESISPPPQPFLLPSCLPHLIASSSLELPFSLSLPPTLDSQNCGSEWDCNCSANCLVRLRKVGSGAERRWMLRRAEKAGS